MLRDLFRFGRRPAPRDDVSIVICSIDEERFRKVSANYAARMGAGPYEIIRIGDAKSLSEGYNRGLAQAKGDIILFSHDDIEILTPDFRQRLVAHLQQFDLVGVAGTSRLINARWNTAGQPWVHGQAVQPARSGSGYVVDIYGQAKKTVQAGIQALDGMFIAARRVAAEALRFDETRFDAFHLYDMDFTYRAFLARMPIGVANDILIYHASLGNFDQSWDRYAARFQEKFDATLDKRPPGVPTLHAREPVRSLEDALKLFNFYLRECGVAEAA
jgi:GT2 family glycosyltransferase